MSESQNNYQFNSGNLLVFFYRWRKVLIIVTFVAAVAAAVVSLFIPNKYKSTVVVFPTSTNSISKTLLSKNPGKEDLMEFGDEDQADQLIQLLKSEKIRTTIEEKYDLMKHYHIKNNDKYSYTKLNKEYNSNVSFERTKYLSVQIKVLDQSADTAALIANSISQLVDSVKNQIRRQIAVKAYEIVKTTYDAQIQYIKDIQDSLNAIRSGDKNKSKNTSYNLKLPFSMDSKKRVDVFRLEKYGANYIVYIEKLDHASEQLGILKAKYDQAKVNAFSTIQAKFVVNSAHPAEKKSYPIRWLIVVVTAIATFILTLFVIISYESFKNLRAAEKARKSSEEDKKEA